MKTNVRRIAVIGFGSAGAAASITLRRLGFDVDVYEQATHIGPVGAGILLHPSGQLVLERLGLLDDLVAKSERIESIFVKNHAGKKILDIRYDESVKGRTAYGVLRRNLFDGLSEAARTAGVSFHLGSPVSRIDVESSQARLFFQNQESSDPYDLVLVCDGARSRLRESLVRWQRLWHYSYGARWTLGHCQNVRGRLEQVVHGTKHLIGVLPTGHGTASFFWGTSPGEKTDDFQAWKETVLQFCPPAEELLQGKTNFQDFIETKYFQLFMGQSLSPNIVFLGDAWHAMSPHLGQGTNLALLDGYILATELARFQGDLLAAKREFLKMRLSNNRLYATLSFSFSPFFQSGGWLKGELRDTFLPIIASVPWLRRQMVLSISGLKKNYFSFQEADCPPFPHSRINEAQSSGA